MVRDKLGAQVEIGDMCELTLNEGAQTVRVFGRVLEVAEGGLVVPAGGHKRNATLTKPMLKCVVYVECEIDAPTRYTGAILKCHDPNPEVAKEMRENSGSSRVALN